MTFNVTSAGTYITNLQKLHWKLLQFSKGPGCHLIIIIKKKLSLSIMKKLKCIFGYLMDKQLLAMKFDFIQISIPYID